jgi:hypothetical protein
MVGSLPETIPDKDTLLVSEEALWIIMVVVFSFQNWTASPPVPLLPTSLLRPSSRPGKALPLSVVARLKKSAEAI